MEDAGRPFQLADRYASALAWIFGSYVKRSDSAGSRESTMVTQVRGTTVRLQYDISEVLKEIERLAPAP